MRRTKLYANRDHALAARKQAAKGESGAGFGFEALAVQDFFEEAWTIWGDERRLVSPLERSLLVWKLLGEQQVLGQTLGTARLLEGFLEQAAGVFETVPLAATATTSELLKNAVEAVAGAYYAKLREQGLIEAGEAAMVLNQMMPAPEIELAEYVQLLPAQRRLLEQWGVDISLLDVPAQLETLSEDVEPTFLIPAGATATYSLIKDEIEEYLDRMTSDTSALETDFASQGEEARIQRRAVVLTKRPQEAFNALAPYWAEQGIACSVEETVEFLDTWVGKACNAVWQLMNADGHWLFAATDFAYNPLSGMSSFAAEALNTTYRGDRRLTVVDIRQDLMRQSTYGLFKALLEGVRETEERLYPSEPKGLLAEKINSLKDISEPIPEQLLQDLIGCLVPYDQRDRELAMVNELLRTLETAHTLGLNPKDVFDVLLGINVKVGQETGDGEDDYSLVAFAPFSTANQLSEKSQGLVILGDVSTEAFNLSTEHSSLEAFAAQLGIELIADPLQDAFRLFAAAQKAAKYQFTCVRPLHNEAMEEAFSSCIYDEYRALLTRSQGAAENVEACSFVEKHRGEEHLNIGLGSTFVAPERVEKYQTAQRGELTYASVLTYLPTVEEKGSLIPVLSASAIEAYLNCPYLWFVNHALGLSSLDEGYEAREKGTFIHQVLAVFFGRLKATGLSLTEELLQEGSLFDQVFDQVREEQWGRSHNRLIAITETEKRDLELLRQAVRKSLCYQIDLPQGYQPTQFEYRIAADEGIDYAGARLRGSIDRVDVDPKTGDFVVLDYKSSSYGHEAPFSLSGAEEEFSLPPYVQALIYAQAVRRKGLETLGESEESGSLVSELSETPELNCAGALYLGYKAKAKKNLLEGSYDQSRYKVQSFTNKDSGVKGNFSDYLDLVEESVQPYVQALTAGVIAGEPRAKDSCRYCILAGRGQCLARRGIPEDIDEEATLNGFALFAQGVE